MPARPVKGGGSMVSPGIYGDSGGEKCAHRGTVMADGKIGEDVLFAGKIWSGG